MKIKVSEIIITKIHFCSVNKFFKKYLISQKKFTQHIKKNVCFFFSFSYKILFALVKYLFMAQ